MTRETSAGAACGLPPCSRHQSAPVMRAKASMAATVAGLLIAMACAQAAHAGDDRAVRPQPVVSVLSTRSVHSRPAVDARTVAMIAARRPITAQPTIVPVLDDDLDEQGRAWLRIRLPGRVLKTAAPPRTGWIRALNTRLSMRRWHIVVDVGARRVRVYRDGRRLRNYQAIVGTRSTPTPLGNYFVEENIRLRAGDAGAPFALATSARSNVLQEFAGGPGQIALHGVANIGGQLGSAQSHGCIRLTRRAITWLATRITPGTPISIIANSDR